MESNAGAVRVLCVDDNPLVADALRIRLERAGGFAWVECLPSTAGLLEAAERERIDVLVLDIDMPGRDPFSALRDLVRTMPSVRAVMFSGHVRPELVERALDAGAWGYVSKNDGESALVDAIRTVMSGELAMSAEVRVAYD